MKIKTRFDENNKCPCCNWKNHQLFGFESNPDREMICGECFCQMLVEEGYNIQKGIDTITSINEEIQNDMEKNQ